MAACYTTAQGALVIDTSALAGSRLTVKGARPLIDGKSGGMSLLRELHSLCIGIIEDQGEPRCETLSCVSSIT